LPRSARSARIARNVCAGKRLVFRQTQTASYLRPIALATALIPPSSSMTARVVVSMGTHNTENYSDCKPRNLFACPDIISGFHARMDWRRLTVSQRLAILRKSHALTQEAFALAIGVDPDTDTYGKAERSGQVAQLAPRIWARFPEIDAGWLFQGLAGNISQATEKRLSDAATALGINQDGARRQA
jgi:DNA-binding XRE family transcriptional regulator